MQEIWIVECIVDIGQKDKEFKTSQEAIEWLFNSSGINEDQTVTVKLKGNN